MLTIPDGCVATIEGRYNYYFNSGNKEDIFREEVAYLVESMGIKNYTLTIE